VFLTFFVFFSYPATFTTINGSDFPLESTPIISFTSIIYVINFPFFNSFYSNTSSYYSSSLFLIDLYDERFSTGFSYFPFNDFLPESYAAYSTYLLLYEFSGDFSFLYEDNPSSIKYNSRSKSPTFYPSNLLTPVNEYCFTSFS
jgi:hypothetical protein